MEFNFKALRPGIFLPGVLARLDESTREIILDVLNEADERLASLEAATPAPLADAALAELETASRWLDEENELQGGVDSLLVIIRNGTVPAPGEEEQSVLECFLEMAARLRRYEVLRNALPGLLARVRASEAKLQLIRATATRSVPNCLNLDAIDRILAGKEQGGA